MNIIQTKTIGELILSKQTPDREHRVEHYLIPYYQRGYRWEEHHVKILLNDIHNFMQEDNTNYYCLQPIVASNGISKVDNLPEWEIIDGQQRLITLYLIFRCIKKTNFDLYFENRYRSVDFIRNISEDTMNHENPDFHFMSLAYDTISKWFKEQSAVDVSYIDEFYTTCCKRVKVIWYQLENNTENEKIEVFNRLNIGKIPLTDAELIKALLLSEVKKGLSPREAILRQADVSAEWYSIETELRNDEFWCFLNNAKDYYKSGRIELLFDLLAGRKSSKYSTYLWLEDNIKSKPEYHELFWSEVKEVFTILKSWFNNRDVYHYVGFLLAINHTTLASLFKLSKSKKTKSGFKTYLESEISQYILKINLGEISYDSNRKEIEKILLLFNILTVASYTDISQNRFPFNLYKDVSNNGGWSLEHIHAQKSEDMKDENAIKSWLKETKGALVDIDELIIKTEDNVNEMENTEDKKINLSNIKEEIENMLNLQKIDVRLFNDLRVRITDIFDSKSVHLLDNLALLSKKDNSSLQNAIFPVKRCKLVELESKGAFIPPCTKNVFLKLYNSSNNQPFYWSKRDKITYYDSIKSILFDFASNFNDSKK